MDSDKALWGGGGGGGGCGWKGWSNDNLVEIRIPKNLHPIARTFVRTPNLNEISQMTGGNWGGFV